MIGGGALFAPEAKAILFFDEMFDGTTEAVSVERDTESLVYSDSAPLAYTGTEALTDRDEALIADERALDLPTADEVSPGIPGLDDERTVAAMTPLQGDIPTSQLSPSVDNVYGSNK